MAGRFSYSSPESHRGGTPWFRIGDLDVGTAVLVAGACVLSMVVWAISSDVLEPLVLFADDVRRGQVWRLVTWPLANFSPDIWTIITIAIFWYFGRELEGMLGRNRFAVFLIVLTIAPAIVATLVDLNVAGIEHLELAVFLVFIAEFPFARFFFGIPGWVIGAVIVGLQFLVLIGNRDSDGLVFLVMILVTAAIAARSYGLATHLPWIPRLPLPLATADSSSSPRPSRPRRKPRDRRSSDTVVAGPWTPPPPPRPGPEAAAAQAELDSLLDKISEHGLESLSADEKRRLNELSKRLR